ncbi:cell division protein ZipA [Marinobacterium rhizophilum]|uniref:Cell division protein ZipA n=1 Tax=Marinobacterium rhizophilum TaxID=420402 RepID=A0ABY5HEJ3_9GAMM|nr:cell division protein ZipA [Marinobacterium rhizophilum]UTW10008.1 cell division protein ZipA [Marinobacterium rhizophilum]
MEISLREWLVIGGVVVIALIIFDGWRRVRGGRNSLRMDIDRKLRDLPDEPVESSNNPELPYGGARPISGDAPEFVPKRKPSAAYTAKMATQAAPATERAHEQATERHERIEPTFGLADDDKVAAKPAPQSPASEPGTAARVAPVPDVAPAAFDTPAPPAVPPEPATPAPARRPVPGAEVDPLFDEPAEDDYPAPPPAQPAVSRPASPPEAPAPRSPAGTPASERMSRRTAADAPAAVDFGETDPLFDELPEQPALDLEKPIPLLMERNRQPRRGAAAPESRQAEVEPARRKAKPEAPQQDLLFGAATEAADDVDPGETASTRARHGESVPKPENVLVITAVSTAEGGFPGGLLHRLLAACDLHFGDMAIFHRHEDGSDTGPVQFSMANAVNPGTFDLATIDQMRTPAVTFFMSMEEPRDVMNAFECMLATAETLAEHLDGDLLDENRSVLRPQTKEHYRQRIRDFEMHNRSRRGGSRA